MGTHKSLPRIWPSEVCSQWRSVMGFSPAVFVPHTPQVFPEKLHYRKWGSVSGNEMQCSPSSMPWWSLDLSRHSRISARGTRIYEYSCCIDAFPTDMAAYQAGVGPMLQVKVFYPWRDNQQPVGKPQRQNQECLLPVRIFGCLLHRLLLVAACVAWRDGTIRHHPSHQYNIAEGCEYDE